jgi:hypothetical protein
LCTGRLTTASSSSSTARLVIKIKDQDTSSDGNAAAARAAALRQPVAHPNDDEQKACDNNDENSSGGGSDTDRQLQWDPKTSKFIFVWKSEKKKLIKCERHDKKLIAVKGDFESPDPGGWTSDPGGSDDGHENACKSEDGDDPGSTTPHQTWDSIQKKFIFVKFESVKKKIVKCERRDTKLTIIKWHPSTGGSTASAARLGSQPDNKFVAIKWESHETKVVKVDIHKVKIIIIKVPKHEDDGNGGGNSGSAAVLPHGSVNAGDGGSAVNSSAGLVAGGAGALALAALGGARLAR